LSDSAERTDGDLEQTSSDLTPQGSPGAISVTSIQASEYQGPLPHPVILEGFEKVLPGAAERVFSNWEQEAAHRRKAELHILSQDSRGLACGFVLALVFLAASIWLVHKGNETSGIAVIFAEIVALAGVFVFAQRAARPSKDPAEKKP
jgi:uncharacterized membrane protein